MATGDSGRGRVGFLVCMLGLGLAVVASRLYWVQIVAADRFTALAEDQRVRRIDLAAQRGSIADRDGAELAISMEMQTLYANPRFVTDPSGAAKAIAAELQMDAGDLEKRLRRRSGFVYLARQVDPDKAARIMKMQIPGVRSAPESKRLYPSGTLAAHVIGFVGANNQGLGGLESKFDRLLSGNPGQILTEHDPQGRPIPAGKSLLEPAVAGTDLVLTIDSQIQFRAEKVLDEAIKKWHAKAGSAVVLDPRNGEVLALANVPTFDPNQLRSSTEETRRNRAVQDVYEPGSANKAIVAAAALESGAVTPGEIFSVPQTFRISDKVFKDPHPHPTLNLSFSAIIERSSNIGTIKVAQRLGREVLYDYLRKFGYGETTGVGSPGESPGILPTPQKWWNTSMGSIPIGQGVATTPMQIMGVFSTIANGGVAVAPKLVKAFVSGGKVQPAAPSKSRRVITQTTARSVSEMLLEVTRGKDGTGTLAQINGYQVAGKTGTAQKPKLTGRGYEGYVSSFIGFAPVADPRLVVGVFLDDPRPIYGGLTAAVSFKDITDFSLRHLGIGPGPVLP